jgi:alpha-glucosidase (family GH31 glycosyl hydrolase)
MTEKWNRREVLQSMALATTALALRGNSYAQLPSAVAKPNLDVQILPVSDHTFRLSIFPDGGDLAVTDGSLLQKDWGAPIVRMGADAPGRSVQTGKVSVQISTHPLTFGIADAAGKKIQQLSVDPETGTLSFAADNSPLLGLGEGGPQFDRRGSTDRMVSGQGGYRLATHGGRVPIPWLIGTAGWAMFIHQPFGTFDFSGPQNRFIPGAEAKWPLDLFFVCSSDPTTMMAEYARLTGHAELPPLWSFGYQQSHRTLASREEVLAEAKTFREKKLPCDALIYLGTGFCPSGWNTENGSFAWNSRTFPDPGKMIEQMHQDHFRVVLHAVILADKLKGSASDACTLSRFDEEEAGCYWNAHRKDFAMGVDGWWPDEGDPMGIASRLARNRMYWEGPQIDRPNERPYALHRNGYAGMQRYGSFLWSGDVFSTWETLKTQVPIAINTSLTGIPFWGTDIGGFVPTKEFTAELYLRWFQFGAFCTLFRAHGRAWKLRLPWGWNTGDPGPSEIGNYNGAALPDSSQLHNPQVEPICRKYLELRYRLLPYLYSSVRECTKTGMPVMRALWLHYPDDPKAVACADQYLWGRNLLVAPVVEPGATSRRVYFPRGEWYDFWTGERLAGGREISRAVDLATLPLYVPAGSILPLGPVKQYTGESSAQPFSVSIYPGADASLLLYEDDGSSFNYRRGEWMGIHMEWNDRDRTLTLSLASDSRMLAPLRRNIEVKLGETVHSVVFNGGPVDVKF